MILIVGLGNPGEKYDGTRHNIGFAVVDRLAKEFSDKLVVWEESEKHKSLLFRAGEVTLVKPQTFVNNVGISVGSLVNFFKLEPVDVWVVHDDIDLPLGKIRARSGGGSAGHHGIESIMAHLKTDQFVRFRLGVGRDVVSRGPNVNRKLDHRRVIQFVLSRFRQGEAGEMKHLVKRGAQAVRTAIFDGLDRAMNQYH